MATTISTQDLENVRRDIDDIGKSVNEKVIVSPRYGEDFKSLPMISAEFQISSDAAEAAAVTAVSAAQSASSSANIAEAAATAATIGAGVFETPEAGVDPVTGVADGAYFNVRSLSDESYIDEYQNIGGVPTPSGKSYPSSAALNAVKEAIIDPLTGDAVASKLKDESGLSQQEWNNGVESITDLLAIPNPKNGNRVYVKGFYVPTNLALAQPYVGGGWFFYSDAKRSINNGVTIFNGWVRDLSDKILTTDDAGLLGDGTDDTESLQNFFDVASQYAHLNIKAYGTYNVRTNIIAKNISSLIGTDFHIYGLRESFTFNGYAKGILQILNSPNIEVCGVNLKGVRLSNNNDPVGDHRFENGDAGIHLVDCHNFYAHHNTVDYVKTWGILGEGCNGGTAVYNKISRTTRQSGINIVVGSTSGVAIVAHNEIFECGLYGIELEGRDQSTLNNSRAIVHDNTIYNCGQGIVCVGPNFDTQIHDNTITACEKGVMLVNVNLSDILKGRLTVRDNNIFRCENGISWSGLKHADITGNNINGEQVPSYLIKASNSTVDKILSQNSFRTARNLQINDSIYFPVDGSSYSVVAKESITDTEESGSNAFIVTVSANLSTAITNGDQFKESALAKNGLDAFYQSYEDCDIQGNHVKSYPIGFYNLPAMNGSQLPSFVLGNTFTDCDSPFYLASSPIGASIAKNIRLNCGASTVLQPMLDSGFYEVDYFSIMNGLIRSSNAQPSPTVTQYFNNKVYVSKIRLDMADAKIDAGNQIIVLRINGIDFAQISFSSTSGITVSQEMQITSSSRILNSGKNSFQLIDTSGTLKYANWMVTLIQI